MSNIGRHNVAIQFHAKCLCILQPSCSLRLQQTTDNTQIMNVYECNGKNIFMR